MPSLISGSIIQVREKEKIKTNRARNEAILQIRILAKQWPQALLEAFSQPMPLGPSGQLYNVQCSVHLKNAYQVPTTFQVLFYVLVIQQWRDQTQFSPSLVVIF